MPADQSLTTTVRVWLREHRGNRTIDEVTRGVIGSHATAQDRFLVRRALHRMVDAGTGTSEYQSEGSAKVYRFVRDPYGKKAMTVKEVRTRDQKTAQMPAPAKGPWSAPSAAPGATRETLEEFQARGGKVERLPGFERVQPYSGGRPAWRSV